MSAITRIQRGTNADLIAVAHELYPMGERVLDLTPGDRLGFWTRVVPLGLHVLPAGADYRTARLAAGTWTDVVFDPDYVAKGGRATSTTHEMNARYGMLTTERTPMLQWTRKILPGVDAAHHLLETGGLLWWKLQDYVTNGANYWFTKWADAELRARGFDLVDGFILAGHPGPQPTTDKCRLCATAGVVQPFATVHPIYCPRCAGRGVTPRRQVHARNAHSELLIARKR